MKPPFFLRLLQLGVLALLFIHEPAQSNPRAVCAVVYDYGWDPQTGWFSSPHKGYCEAQQVGSQCDLHTNDMLLCSASDHGAVPWYQAAIDYAANKDAFGNPLASNGRTYPLVAFTRGRVNIKKAQLADWPLQNIGIHVQSGVQLFGSPAQHGTTYIAPDASWAANYNGTGQPGPQLNAMIAVSSIRSGDLLNAPPAITYIDSIALSGAIDTVNAAPACSAYNGAGSYVHDGIVVLNAAPDAYGLNPTVARSRVAQIKGNAIALGFYTPFVDSGIATCSNPLCRLGKVLKVRGTSPQAPAQIVDNTICGVGLGGVTVIGDNVEVGYNTILQVDKVWVDDSRSVGTTMGVSAGFVGSSAVRVHHNVIEGGDYGVGSDGSFPAYIGPTDYLTYWSQITGTFPAFSTRYPSGPYDGGGNSRLSILDSILANQVILDLASHQAAATDDRTGFNTYLEIHDNVNTHSAVGIALFKSDFGKVYGNTISSTAPFNLAGVLVDSSINNFVYSNLIRWWRYGVEVRGLPGTVTYWGSSYNGIGIKPPTVDNPAWTYPGNQYDGNLTNVHIHDAGYGNNVY